MTISKPVLNVFNNNFVIENFLCVCLQTLVAQSTTQIHHPPKNNLQIVCYQTVNLKKKKRRDSDLKCTATKHLKLCFIK